MKTLELAAVLTISGLLAGSAVAGEGHCATKAKSCCKKGTAAKAAAQKSKAKTGKPAAAAPGTASVRAVIDKETGQLRAPTPEESKEMALRSSAARADLNESDEGLVEVVHPNGMISVDLQGRFMSHTVAKIGPDGKLITRCVTTEAEKKAFLQKKAEPKPSPVLDY